MGKENGLSVMTQWLWKEFCNRLPRNATYSGWFSLGRSWIRKGVWKSGSYIKRKVNSTVSYDQNNLKLSAVMRTGVKVGSPGPHQSWFWVWGTDFRDLRLWGQFLFQRSPQQRGHDLGGSILAWGHFLSLPQRKQAPGFSFLSSCFGSSKVNSL